MRIVPVHLWLALAVALIGGGLPLHVCLSHGGEAASVQVAGCHGHDHDHGVPGDPERDATCCEDVPFDRVAPGAPVSVPPLALAPVATTQPVPATAAREGARPVVTAAPPRERGLIVLLR